MSLDPVHLTRSLIDIESITYNEGAVGLWLEGYLQGLGFAVERTPVPQPADSRYSGERFNLYACEQGIQPDLVFSTHMDTVPPFVPSSEDEEFIYGRGSLRRQGHHRRPDCRSLDVCAKQGVKVGLLFVVGEERDSAGARLANENPKGSRFLINGEPTDNRLALASKGALRADLPCHRQDGPLRLSRTRRQRDP